MKRIWWSVLVAGVGLAVFAGEDHADGVVAEVLARVARVKAAQPEAVPIAIWDFDGTIIWADATLGSIKSKPYYTGLMKSAILAGLNNVYHDADGWERYFNDDRLRLRDLAQWLAVPFRAQMYAGRTVAEIEALATERFENDLRKMYFTSSIRILNALKAAGVENHIISGSPEVFLRGAVRSLGVRPDCIHGVRVAVEEGRLTTQVLYPLPVESGKIELMMAIVKSHAHGVVVAGFGNDYRADGPFLKAIATQTLPGGTKGFSLMINGKNHDPAYDGLFRCVIQTSLAEGQ